jgi:phospholipase D1/2
MHYQYISICRGPKSIIQKLVSAGIDPDQYIRFYSLRGYDRINRSKVEDLLVQAAGYTDTTDEQLSRLGSYNRDNVGRRAEFVHRAGDQDFARGTQGAFNVDEEVEYRRIPDQVDVDKYRARYDDDSIAHDSVAKDAMEGGSIKDEPWVNDTTTSRPRDDRAQREEASDYVSEEVYIHAKLLIADGKLYFEALSSLP